MNDNELDVLLDAERRRTPPAPPVDAIWTRIDRDLAAVTASKRRTTQWLMYAGGIAAALTLGVYLGRATAPGAPTIAATDSAAGTARAELDPYRRTIEELLGRSAVLLAALPHEAAASEGDVVLAEQGAQLLGTVRLLLDSPVGADTRMNTLLGDLELVLVQVARLQATHPDEELMLIHDALNERDIVPRIRSAAVDYSSRLN